MDKKAQIGKKIANGVILIVSVVVMFLVFAGIVPEAQTAGNTMSDDTKCAEAGCFVNLTLSPTCRNNVSPAGFGGNSSEGCLLTVKTIPLSGLFSGSGIIILLLMVFLFLGVLKMVLPGKSKN